MSNFFLSLYFSLNAFAATIAELYPPLIADENEINNISLPVHKSFSKKLMNSKGLG